MDTKKPLLPADPAYVVDSKTPRHTLLSARYKQTFAYRTMRYRLPLIINDVIEGLKKDSKELIAEFGEVTRRDLPIIIEKVSNLKRELENDCVLKTFAGNELDKPVWNAFLKTLDADSNRFLSACWLYAECYVYRRLQNIFEMHIALKSYDYFAKQKKNAFIISEEAMILILEALQSMEGCVCNENLRLLLKLNLWGNRCDLSISSGKEVKFGGNPFDALKDLEANVIIDQSPLVIKCIRSADHSKKVVVEFIIDNAGYELFTDFVLANYLIETKLVDQVRFHLKAIPWFISDVTIHDFRWTLQYMKGHTSPILKSYGKKWQQFVVDDRFQVANVDFFWTSPYEFYRMPVINPSLYARLSEAHLVLFKGDLNYRKLISEFSWDSTEPFKQCLRDFRPTNVCSLRTVKAELICGLAPGKAEELEKLDENWMTTGEYGTIQFASKDDK